MNVALSYLNVLGNNTVISEIFASYFHETSWMGNFMKIKPSRNHWFTDVGKSCPCHEYLTWQMCQ